MSSATTGSAGARPNARQAKAERPRRLPWRRLEAPPPPPPAPAPAPALEPDFDPTFAAFLDQGRWLLREQQERGRKFQANAVALLGFDGVVLGILASNDFLSAEGSLAARTVFGVLAVLALAVSAFAAVRVITPRGTGSVVIDDTLDAWEDLHKGSEVLANQHFAHMLLARDPAPTTSASSEARWWQRRKGQPQVLHQAADLARFRSRWATASAVALLSALAALVVVILVPLFDSDGGTSSQTPSPSITTQR